MPAKKDAGKKARTNPGKPPAKSGSVKKDQDTVKAPGGESPGFQLEAFLASLRVRNIVILSTVLLVLGTILIITLYKVELDDSSKLLQSVHAIRRTMVGLNPSFGILSDPQILEEARQLIDKLSWRNNRNENLESRIQDIQEKKKEGWETFNGHLYFFAPAQSTMGDARMDCKRYKSMLVSITSSEEQLFLERQTLRKGTPHWIGLFKRQDGWFWETRQKVQAPIMFWAPGKPDALINTLKRCAFIKVTAGSRLNTWNDESCIRKHNWICKLAPDPAHSE